MDQLTVDDIAALREPVRRLCADRFDRAHVRESGQPARLDRDAWIELADVGIFAMLTPEDAGGLDLGLVAAAALWEESGQGLAPGPLTWTVLAAQHLPGAGSGDVIVAGTDTGHGPMLVADGPEADQIVVVADEGVSLYLRENVDLKQLASVDPFASLAQIDRLGDAERIGDASDAARWRRAGAVLTAAYLVGASRLALDLSVTHARDRVQFGRPVAGFQAVKHLLADIAVGTELASIAVRHAAAALDAGAPDAPRAAHAAKVAAGDAARTACKNAIQVHGGMGYTWEADPHLIWKRCLVWEQTFGDADLHAGLLALKLSEEDTNA